MFFRVLSKLFGIFFSTIFQCHTCACAKMSSVFLVADVRNPVKTDGLHYGSLKYGYQVFPGDVVALAVVVRLDIHEAVTVHIMFLMNIERVVLKLEHPDCGPRCIHKDVDVAVQWIAKEFVSHYLRQLAVAVAHVGAPRYEIEVLLSGKC